jgi:hypothetical protein
MVMYLFIVSALKKRNISPGLSRPGDLKMVEVLALKRDMMPTIPQSFQSPPGHLRAMLLLL